MKAHKQLNNPLFWLTKDCDKELAHDVGVSARRLFKGVSFLETLSFVLWDIIYKGE